MSQDKTNQQPKERKNKMNCNPADHDLDFLHNCTKEELEPIVGAILGKDEHGNINKRGRLTSDLDKSDTFKQCFPDHTKYVDDIIAEIQQFGSNTFATAFRGCGVPYHEVLCDVCDKLKVNYSKMSRAEKIEHCLIEKVLDDAWEKMSQDDRDALLKELGKGRGKAGGSIGSAIIVAFRMGGFNSYRITLIVVNAIAKAILGRGITLAGNAAICRVLGVLAGPIGWAITGAWTALDIASEAYRITIPACVYIAALRMMKQAQESAGNVDEDSAKERLLKLNMLKDMGVISEDEYNSKRAEILASL